MAALGEAIAASLASEATLRFSYDASVPTRLLMRLAWVRADEVAERKAERTAERGAPKRGPSAGAEMRAR